jgi:anthranilate/para-aminobenzoate synthase component I
VSFRLDPSHDDEHDSDVPTQPAAPRWIGFIPYEARRGLERPGWTPRERRPATPFARPEWRRYRAVACVDHAHGRVTVVGMTERDVGALAALLRGLAPRGEDAPRIELSDAEPLARHAERIAAAKELILRGEIYQVNLARKLRVAIPLAAERRSASLLALYRGLARAAPTPFGAFLDLGDGRVVLSTSPELLLDAKTRRGGRSFDAIWTRPIKGTRPRGRDAIEDAALAATLDADAKERAELWMIVDVERNDLGRIARSDTVRVVMPPRLVTHRTVHHREAVLRASVRRDVRRDEVLRAMVPSGSVTGAPKVRAMEVIARLEPFRRGLYTGAIGYVAYDGSMTCSMAIRTLVVNGEEGEYFTGGGIVADSDPQAEVEETRWKALQLIRVAGTTRAAS